MPPNAAIRSCIPCSPNPELTADAEVLSIAAVYPIICICVSMPLPYRKLLITMAITSVKDCSVGDRFQYS
ncbi:hypothetical protein [Nostoc sp.]|uniref:hypothetical protein n=1 Tax=Nostoc sp. TaxID=1180 RepID=UPI002FFAA6BF